MLEAYVAVDLEMTGLHARTDRILEIGAVKVEQGIVSETYQRLVNPRMELREEIISLTGITNQMAKQGSDTGEAVEGFLKFAKDLPLVGHNIIYDYSFLKQYTVNHGIVLEKEAVDTLKLARKFLPQVEKKSLDYLCEVLKIERARNHRALEDAKATAELLEYLKAHFYTIEPKAFVPKLLQYKVKKQSPATSVQKRHLKELAEYHKIELDRELDSLTRNEASRITDKILASYGKVPR
ncbi:MAG: 3'-5' exonuclease [Lachnospiraceae bacterium]|jgi:exonuclease, DNA polymerase III, epsilon subunit family|nr:3'-5' exonuclease [Lachnospiraceae bacterium]